MTTKEKQRVRPFTALEIDYLDSKKSKSIKKQDIDFIAEYTGRTYSEIEEYYKN